MTAAEMDPQTFLDLLAQGRELLKRERRFCERAALAELTALAPEKAALVARIEEGAATVPGSKRLSDALEALIAEARKNERLLIAVRNGVLNAKRHLERLREARRGAVAYREDGGTVISREDAAGASKRA
ncbi:MAG: hypothetical protein AAF074_02250 [Pseudomonadota bacterium]